MYYDDIFNNITKLTYETSEGLFKELFIIEEKLEPSNLSGEVFLSLSVDLYYTDDYDVYVNGELWDYSNIQDIEHFVFESNINSSYDINIPSLFCYDADSNYIHDLPFDIKWKSGQGLIELTTRIPEDYLDTASYPVECDPSFNIITDDMYDATNFHGPTFNWVWINDSHGYVFYVNQNDDTPVYRKTTDGATTFGDEVILGTDKNGMDVSVWYDRWTPGLDGDLITMVRQIVTGKP